MAANSGDPNIFATVASKVDGFFADKFYRLGQMVGSRPLPTIGLSLLLLALCASGMSQLESEDRSDKLWIPQDTQALKDQKRYEGHFPGKTRYQYVLLEGKAGVNMLSKDALTEALELHDKVEAVKHEGEVLRDICLAQPGDGHPCMVTSVLQAWSYNTTILSADADPITTITDMDKTQEALQRMIGGAEFDSNDKVTSGKSLRIGYFLRRTEGAYGMKDPKREAWEEKYLEVLKCDAPSCTDGVCRCAYEAKNFVVYAEARRSWSDAFGTVIRGDVGLINGAFMIMIVYLVMNLGGLFHKVNSRALLAVGCTVSIVAAGASGYGLAMLFGFKYTPVHSVLPFVLIGIGVDDSFVIMNALDRTDPDSPIPDRIGKALSQAGASIMVTSMTDFAAFAISVGSGLPALSSFCMYAALCVFMMFVFQVTMFTAMATLDARRVSANRIDCCFCLPRGCPCCPVVPKEQAREAMKSGSRDPNQMLCCYPAAHPGGRIGAFLQGIVGPAIVKPIIGVPILLAFVGLSGLCAWQASLLSVQDTMRSFIPDNSYVLSSQRKSDEYFGMLGQPFYLLTESGDYFASQKGLVATGPRLDLLDFVVPTDSSTLTSWAAAFKDDCQSGAAGQVTLDADGLVADRQQYYGRLQSWLDSPSGRRYAKDVIWVDTEDAQKGIKASRISAELRSVKKKVGDRVVEDAENSVEMMDKIRAACNSWTGMPGNKVVPYSRMFTTWETFKIIRKEMFMAVGLCIAAVFVITLALIAHPVTAILVLVCVVMTLADILGFMNMWHLSIDSVSVIQLVIAVGLCVDYAVHVAHNFMLQAGTRAERAVLALGDVGAAVLCGGVSTFLGVMLLSASGSYVFRVLFQVFLLTVLLGLAHGMLVLPILLSLVGPASYAGHTSGVVKAVADKQDCDA